MCGSTPELDAVTASAGTASGATPSRAAIAARRCSTWPSSLSENPPWFEPPEVDGSPGPRTSSADADGRVWKYGSAAGSVGTGSIPISDEPVGVPSDAVTTDP